MDAHEGGRGSGKVAANEGDVLVVVDVAGVGDHAEFAKTRGKNGFSDAADVAFVLHAVANEVGHREHLQIVFLQNSMSWGTRAMVPSSFMISQMTPAGLNPAMRARSTEASVWPARTRTPPVRARSGKMWPGRARSCGLVFGSMAARMVMARSEALMPVVTPRRASMASQKAVPWTEVLMGDMSGR